MKRLIVTADDFGASPEVNDAVEQAHRDGILTAASLMVAGKAAADAVARARALPTLGVGLHIVLVEGRPVLGVCVGMQMMADRSQEGTLPGLGWIPGEVVRFDEHTFNQRTHLPHMGWNDIAPQTASGLFAGIADPKYYFLHSYHYAPASDGDVLATTSYGSTFASAVGRGQIFGTQFHPEKSHHWGVSLLANFART